MPPLGRKKQDPEAGEPLASNEAINTTPLLPHGVDPKERARQDAIGKAAWQLEDTQQDRLVAYYPDEKEARDAYFAAAAADVWYQRALIILLVLTIFETPSWCHRGHETNWFGIVPSHESCQIVREDGTRVKNTDILLSGLPYMPLGYGVCVEVVLIFMIGRKLWLERSLQVNYFDKLAKKHNTEQVDYVSRKLLNFGLACVVFEFMDSVAFILIRQNWRLAFFSRAGFLCLLPGVQRLAHMVYMVVNQFFTIASFLAGTLLFFAWIFVTIFSTVNSVDVHGEPVNKGLDTFPHALNSLVIAGTTDDLVMILLPSYTNVRICGILWLVFLVLVHVLLLNLVLDTLVAAYMTYAEELEEKTIEEKVDGIQQAFHTLCDAVGESGEHKEISKQTFLEFVREFSRSPRTRVIKDDTAEIMLHCVDKDSTGRVGQREFCDLTGVMLYDFWTTRTHAVFKESAPGCWNSAIYQAWVSCVEQGYFDIFMNWVLTINLCLVVIEGYFDLEKLTEPKILESLELYFSLAYVMEFVLKMTVFSWAQYWANRSNQFDFFTTWLLLGSSMADELAAEGGSMASEIKRYANVLRLLRLLRIMKQLKRFPAVTLMVETIIRLVYASKDILSLLGVVMFFFTTLAVQLWGGLMYNSAPELEESEWVEKKHFVLNFNDVPMSFGVWVVSLICEYVPELPEAIEMIDHRKPYSWLVFNMYYVFAVSIVFELVMAFTIEVFMELRKRMKVAHEDKELEAITELIDMFAKQGQTLHYRIVGDASVQEKIVEALEELDREREEHEHGGGHGHGHGGGEAPVSPKSPAKKDKH
jgi:hypothetical protein